MPLTREQIVGKKLPVPVKAVENTTLGAGLYVRKLPPRDRNLWDKIIGENDGLPLNGDARLFVLLACDEHGNRIFTDGDANYFGDEAGHADAVRIALDVGIELNRVTKAMVDSTKKNLPETGNGSPPSGSPTT